MTEKKVRIASAVYTALMGLAMLAVIARLLRDMGWVTASPAFYIRTVLLLFTSAFGAYYLLDGCKKGECSRYYAFYMGACAFSALFALGNNSIAPLAAMSYAVSVAAFTLLCFARDFGRKYSLAAVWTAVAASLLSLLVPAFSGGEMAVFDLVALVHAVSAQFMVVAKYFDKQQRGRAV